MAGFVIQVFGELRFLPYLWATEKSQVGSYLMVKGVMNILCYPMLPKSTCSMWNSNFPFVVVSLPANLSNDGC